MTWPMRMKVFHLSHVTNSSLGMIQHRHHTLVLYAVDVHNPMLVFFWTEGYMCFPRYL